MRKPLVLVGLLLCLSVSAQPSSAAAQAVVPTPAPKQFASLTAHTNLSGTGLGLAYGQQDFFAPGTDVRFGVSYTSSSYGYYGAGTPAFGLELNATALAYTYDPQPDAGLALVAYGGLGPRFIVQTGIYNPYDPELSSSLTAYTLAVSGVGGFETRIQNFGIFMELELGLPVFGLYGPQFLIFPLAAGSPFKISLGGNYYF